MRDAVKQLLVSGAGVLAALVCGPVAMAQVGLFAGHGDVGKVLHAGDARFDPAKGTYTVAGSGENLWSTHDEFQYVWTKVSGDVALSADISFVGTKGNPHRKAALMIRQSLDTSSAYVDVARHGDGLTSLQYRAATGADTHEVETASVAPQRVRIERRGDYAYVFVGEAGGQLNFSGAAMRLPLSGEFYVGLAVCAHDKDVTETAVFSNVQIERLPPATGKTVLYSTLETVIVNSTDRRVRHTEAVHFEAPNWTRDGTALIYNQDGGLRRWTLDDGVHPNDRTIPLQTASMPIPTGAQTKCNNDHGLSPDGTQIAISDSSVDGKSHVYVLPLAGGTPRLVTKEGPSYWHGWSPDGSTLAFTGQRRGEFDIYTIPAGGGAETRLTTAPGLDDGPEYSPDGQWIYFNSERTGHMQIWRMHPDGSGQEQVLQDENNDWFPHLSPDGKRMVFVAYKPGVKGHPPNEDVALVMVSLPDRKTTVLASLFGGQGTMNVPCWSPDGTKVAFVSYALVAQ
ncbi:MAG TPA: hypothetical protein VKV02_07770 [Acidobacteriaceae bacterium]|nr:hypothetical protein [Acidobacteriaceae bacterium]